MANSSIEWTDSTWNPVTGCTRASAGCDFCYAVAMTRRLEAIGQEKYSGLVNPGKNHFNGKIKLHPDALDVPLKKRKGLIWFVNSMSDLFHPNVPFDFVAAVFGIMAATPQHTYQVLTKRPERMRAFFDWLRAETADMQSEKGCSAEAQYCAQQARLAGASGPQIERTICSDWPLTNVWMGTSVESNDVAARIEHLREVPAHVRFLSCEPLIGPLDLRGKLTGIHWVIAGGESGHGAREMRMEWATAIQAACADAGVAYFFKQLGSVLAGEHGIRGKGSGEEDIPSHMLVREYPEQVAIA